MIQESEEKRAGSWRVSGGEMWDEKEDSRQAPDMNKGERPASQVRLQNRGSFAILEEGYNPQSEWGYDSHESRVLGVGNNRTEAEIQNQKCLEGLERKALWRLWTGVGPQVAVWREGAMEVRNLNNTDN